ncbi:udp-glucose 4-epimerase [Holotrichia oblita]|nr:udp-glucose 4-epimerase [Holotrichia oblita]
MRDKKQLTDLFASENIEAVIHFAALKAVAESVSRALDYYGNNLGSLITLCEVMRDFNVKKLVFSSSATVYGSPHAVPITEDFPTSATNPYGYTKLICERILQDMCFSDPSWSIVLLRYFNPVGAHQSGLIGEDPAGIPNNLMPYIAQVAVGKLEKLYVNGNDYDTKDGTGVRDYIHIVDLARGHLSALAKMTTGVAIYNLGTGTGYSVLEMIDNFAKASGKHIPYEIAARRPGDISECYADPSKAMKELGWQAIYNVEDMCRDTWNWQYKNPRGFRED